MTRSPLHDLTLELIAETDRAILVSDDGGETKHWLPLSQVEVTRRRNNIVEVTAPEWLLIEKGLV